MTTRGQPGRPDTGRPNTSHIRSKTSPLSTESPPLSRRR